LYNCNPFGNTLVTHNHLLWVD